MANNAEKKHEMSATMIRSNFQKEYSKTDEDDAMDPSSPPLALCVTIPILLSGSKICNISIEIIFTKNSKMSF